LVTVNLFIIDYLGNIFYYGDFSPMLRALLRERQEIQLRTVGRIAN